MSSLFKGGRLDSVEKDVTRFTSSLQSDKVLLKPVIEINKAHVVMMMEQEIIDWPDGSRLLQALNELSTGMNVRKTAEDIHMSLEEEVIKKAGLEAGGNMHIGKSRNDQVSTAIRMRLREKLIDLALSTVGLQETLTNLAEKHLETIVPGFTHLQPAQPVTFAHYLLSYNDALERSIHRLEESYQRTNLCPMGAAALATSSFPISRERVANLLGFSGILENSIDAVGSRDFILETMANMTLLAVDISRLTEDLIVWSSAHFGILELPDKYSSTSSIMPQKKNPDVLEVIRARMSHVLGNFVTSAAIMKSLPSSYNLDLQEVTPRLWESLEETAGSVQMLSKIVASLKVNKDTFGESFLSSSTSTELVNVLVRKYHVPFRTAHRIVGALMRHLAEDKSTLSDLTPELLKKAAGDSVASLSDVRPEDLRACTDPVAFVKAHCVRGGPAPVEVRRMTRERKKQIAGSRRRLAEKKSQLNEAENALQSVIKTYLTAKEPSKKLKNSAL